MSLSAVEIKNLLNERGIFTTKSKGQNFLIDANIPEKIVRLSGIERTCGVLEVGPGLGALTVPLSGVAGRVLSIELDSRLLPILSDIVGSLPNVELIHGDVLKLDIGKMVGERDAGIKWHVCSNLPYNITTPALTAFFNAGVFDTITVMIQREVAGRISARPGSGEYGAFTVFANYHCSSLETLFDVPPECFFPRPAVFSSVIQMKTRRSRLLAPVDEALFFRVVRAAFGQRRKTLVNALYAVFGGAMDKGAVESAVVACGFDPRARGETLGLEEYLRLSAAIATSSPGF